MVRPRQDKPARQLLTTLTDNPALPTFIRRLPAPTLQRLIDRVGVADAGALIALTSTEQLRDLFEVSLWQNLAPGQDEVLRSDRFLAWLDVLLEVSPSFAAERLIELGENFLTLQLEPLIEVITFSVAVTHRDGQPCSCMYCELIERGEAAALFGDYLVRAVHVDEWDSVHALLVEFDSDHADVFARLLARCCHAPSALGYFDDGQQLRADETYARTERRERSGFVTPSIAAVFLSAARTADHAAILAQDSYDAISKGYFDRLTVATAAVDGDADAALDTPDDPLPAAAPAQLRALQAALVDADVVVDSTRLLTGPRASREPMLELQAQLDRLQHSDPATFARRLAELVFLANVLMAGTRYQGDRFAETDAAQAVLACANLGMDYAIDRTFSRVARAEAVESMLCEDAGLVRLFQAGWHLLQRLPRHAANALLAVLHAPHVRDRLAHKRWLLDDIDAALHEPDILQLIERGQFEDVGDNLLLLSLVVDPHACQCLRVLIADFPRFPLQLNIGFRPGLRAATSSRHVTSVRDLDNIEAFLRGLDELIRV